jgi:MinD superfamily P-loop ATPase
MEGCDYVVLVAEPTPFGLFDLQLAVQLMHKLHFPFGVVINREGMGDEKVEEYLHKENVPILARLPHTDAAATAYSKGKLLIEEFPEFDQYFEELWKNISANQKA